ncbi:MAG TPA: AhpC/TSA family protein [Herpetosiphonaceae bacterium]
MDATKLGEIQVFPGADEAVPLPELWRERPALLFFMRQLGCGLCRQQLLRLRDLAGEFEAAGCGIAVIIMGDGRMAQGLRELYKLPFTVYADSTHGAYDAFDIGEGSLWDVLGPHIVARQALTALNGMKPMWGAGSIRQLGGLVLIDEQSQVLYRHIANPIYNYPAWESVLETFAALRREGAEGQRVAS